MILDMELEPHDHCPFCEGYCVERWEDEEVKYGDALYPEKQVKLMVHIPTYYCTSCKFGWRDFRSEQIIDEAVQRYLKANELGGN